MDYKSVVIFLAVIAIIFALIAYFITPPEKRYKSLSDLFEVKHQGDPDEFAPLYSKRERINFLIRLGVGSIAFLVLFKTVFIPWFKGYAKVAHTHEVLGIPGTSLIFYGLFIGIPLMLALTLFVLEGRKSIQRIKLGQSPLPKEKVFIPTRYSYGWKVKFKAWMLLIGIVLLLVLSLWGYFQATRIISG